MKRIPIYLVLLFALIACDSRTSLTRMFDSIDSLSSSQHPQKALEALDNISPMYASMDKGERMKYEFLYVKAKAKNYESIAYDSVIVDLADYYHNKGNNKEKMEAYYILGIYYKQKGDAPRALASFSKSLQYADSVRNIRDMMLVHGMLQEVYEEGGLYTDARREMKQAIYYGLKSKDTIAALIYAEFEPWYYLQSRDYDSAEIAANKIYLTNKKIKGGENNTLTLSYSVLSQLEKKNWKKAKRYMDIYERNFADSTVNTVGLRVYLYDYKAKYYAGIGKLDSALHFIRLQQQEDRRLNNYEQVFRNYMNVYCAMGKVDSVNKYANLFCLYNDSVKANLYAERVTQIKSMYDYTQQQEEAFRQRSKSHRLMAALMLVASLGVIVVLSLVMLISRNRRRHAEAMRIEHNQYARLSARYEMVLEQQNMLMLKESEKSKMYDLLQQELEGLRQNMATVSAIRNKESQKMMEAAAVERLGELIAVGGHPSDEEWKELSKVFEENDNGFSKWLADQSGKLNRREMRLCMLSRLHFQPSEAAVLLVTTRQNVTNMRSRMMPKVFGEEGSAADFGLRIAEI